VVPFGGVPYYVTEALELGFRYAFAISVAQVAMGGHPWVTPRAHCVTEALELRYSIRLSNIRGPGVIR